MAGLFNSYYYGKAGKADYTPENLPANRVQLFFETMRIRFSSLVAMNLLYALFALPAIIWTAINVMAIENAASGEAGGFVTVYLLGLIPCFMILAVVTPGFVYVFRNWARDQHAFTISDFKDAVKGNWKMALIVGAVNGVSLLLTYVSYVFYGGMAGQGNVFWVVPQMFVVIACALWWMANMVLFPMMVTYAMKLSQLVRNSFIITLARLPWAILFWAMPAAVPVVLLLFIPYGTVVALVLYLLIGFSLTLYAQVSYANACFDRFLNPRIEGAPVNLGLRDPDLEDEDDDVPVDKP